MSAVTVTVTHSWPKVADVDAFFNSISAEEVQRYRLHWRELTPEDYLETFDRWLFAYCSVHTSWQSNVRGFQAIREWTGWYQNSDELKRRLTDSRIGLQHNRTRFITKFCNDYWRDPSAFYKHPNEQWVTYRNRLVNSILGLGKAKVSFALELIYPCAAEVVCLDTHMFQFYGLDQTKHSNQYDALERHWVSSCLARNIPSAVARAIYWDRKQQKPTSQYWTYVFERPSISPSSSVQSGPNVYSGACHN
jgi:thermostable 8-oxoguanine DNA glycosylase